MGTIRTLLALAVVFAHAGVFAFVGGRLAVQLFYIISGFLMSYILTETDHYKSASKFYINRFLRLFPLYWLVAILTLFMWIIAFLLDRNPGFFHVYKSIDLAGFLSLTLSNIVIFGQDWIMFTGVRDGNFQLVSNFRDSEIPVWHGLLVPQAWTLGVELTFYIIAPFVLRNKKLIFMLLFASLALRVYLIEIGLGLLDPWDYRFFPAELALFLLGSLSHQILKPFYQKIFARNIDRISKIVTPLIFFYCSILFLLPHKGIHTLLLISLFLLSLPLLFIFQSTSKIDSRIGDFSYPIYISHMLVIYVVRILGEKIFDTQQNMIVKTLLVVLLTLVLSYFLERFVSDRVEKLRERIKTG